MQELDVTADMSSQEILALLETNQRLKVACQMRQFSNWVDFYPPTADALDEIRESGTLHVRHYYAVAVGDVPAGGPYRLQHV